MAALTATRFATSFLALLLPTTLMGATLPIVMKSALTRSVLENNSLLDSWPSCKCSF
jgi:hypothetical protein